MIITKATKEDLSEILQLQYLSYQSEAKLLNNFDIPPLKQTLQEVQNEYDNGTRLKVLDDNNRIIGSVRGYIENGTLYIGKLFVHPFWQGKGIGTDVYKRQDPELLAATGGIVQGMSGSPIVQNGKLIGAVTHVFVQDSTKGYGIFIEKMLED